MKHVVKPGTLLILLILVSAGCKRNQHYSGLEAALEKEEDVRFEQAMVGPQEDGTYIVATTQKIDPAGKTVQFPGRPMDLAISPDQSQLVIKNKSDLVFMDLATQSIIQILPLISGGHTFAGIDWSEDGKKVWTTDTRGYLRSASRGEDEVFKWTEEILFPGPREDDKNALPGGFAIDPINRLMYVALSRNNSVGVVNLKTNTVESQIPVGIAPYTVVLLGQKAYVSNWGGRKPTNNDTTGPTSGSQAVVDPSTGIASTGTVSVIDISNSSVT
ncbi:MAG: hypothetical protein KDC53_05385, partial [Saprospiraceae bacterium]|nr:hypothetical protein [Saprospiraceae bacterium]